MLDSVVYYPVGVRPTAFPLVSKCGIDPGLEQAVQRSGIVIAFRFLHGKAGDIRNMVGAVLLLLPLVCGRIAHFQVCVLNRQQPDQQLPASASADGYFA
ncbi:hypothetical protein ACWET9_14030 [Streptomyces sp. NPDC004059]